MIYRKGITMVGVSKESLQEIEKNIYEIPRSYRADMKVPARVFLSKKMIEDILQDRSLWQLVNVATLPGIVKYALAMPDIHEGYGFPIGGVAATDLEKGGVISPGGIGYDINCGVRLLSLSLSVKDVMPFLSKLADQLFRDVPSGVGRGGRFNFDDESLMRILDHGAQELVKLGYGTEEDLVFCEEHGCLPFADAQTVSHRARKRGQDQIGTLGAGNHFLEVQRVDEIFDKKVAEVFGLYEGQVCIMIHCGSRGLGHQVCAEYVRLFISHLSEWGISLPDQELACAPFESKEGQDYFKAMCAAANFAWANRHMIGDQARKACHRILGNSINVKTIYDVSHNIGKQEVHPVDGKDRKLLVHRKGATRSFGPRRPEIPNAYQEVGQPVLIPGTMGTSSYVLVGTDRAMELTFGSTCHGAGRAMSRSKAKQKIEGFVVKKQLEEQGIMIRCQSNRGLAEEAPFAYKDVDNVVKVVDETQIARLVVRLNPIAVIKG